MRHCDLIIRKCAARRVGLRPAMMMILVSAVGRGRARRAAARVRTVAALMRRGAGAGGSGPSASGAFVLPRAPPATRESPTAATRDRGRSAGARAPSVEIGESGPSPPRGGASATNRRLAGKSAGRHMPKTGPPLASEEKTISVKNVEEKKRKERKRKRGPERLRGRMTRATGGAGQHAAWERRRGGGGRPRLPPPGNRRAASASPFPGGSSLAGRRDAPRRRHTRERAPRAGRVAPALAPQRPTEQSSAQRRA